MKRGMKVISFALIISVVMSLFLTMNVFADDVVTLDYESLILEVGQTATLVPSSNSDKELTYKWESSNTARVSVDDSGNITAKTMGSATVTVTASYTITEDVTDEAGTVIDTKEEIIEAGSALCVVTVNSKTTTPTTQPTTTKPTTTEKVTKTLPNYSGTVSVSLEKGKTAQLSPGFGGSIKYTSGNSSVVTVTSTGLITGVRTGTTYVIAYNDQYQQKYQITITAASDTVTATVAGNATVPSESATVTITNSTTNNLSAGYLQYGSASNEDSDEDEQVNDSDKKMRIIIATIGIIAALIILILTIYNVRRNKKNDDSDEYDDFDDSFLNKDFEIDDSIEEDVDFDNDDDDDGETKFYL